MQPEPRPSGAPRSSQFLPLWSKCPEGAGDAVMYASTECKAEVTPSQDGNRTFSYTLEDHTKQAFGIMNELRLSQQLCDVTLQVKYEDIPAAQFMAHKVVLASSSPVFKAMFTNGLREQGMEVVSIEGIHPKVMERLIEFAYTASISVGEKCVLHVMNGAVMYQIDSVVRACSDFLVQQLDPSNAIGIANFAEQIGCTELHQRAREYIYMHFGEVSEAWGSGSVVTRNGMRSVALSLDTEQSLEAGGKRKPVWYVLFPSSFSSIGSNIAQTGPSLVMCLRMTLNS